MSIFKILEALWLRLPPVFRNHTNKLETIRRWIAMYFKSKNQRKVA